MLIRAIDLIFIAFLYVNVLAPQAQLGGIPVSKALLACALLLAVLWSARRPVKLSAGVVNYSAVSFSGILILALIGVFKGNAVDDVMQFVTPFLILAVIPLFVMLIDEYGSRRYLLHFFRAIAFLAVYVIVVFALVSQPAPSGRVYAALITGI